MYIVVRVAFVTARDPVGFLFGCRALFYRNVSRLVPGSGSLWVYRDTETGPDPESIHAHTKRTKKPNQKFFNQTHENGVNLNVC